MIFVLRLLLRRPKTTEVVNVTSLSTWTALKTLSWAERFFLTMIFSTLLEKDMVLKPGGFYCMSHAPSSPHLGPALAGGKPRLKAEQPSSSSSGLLNSIDLKDKGHDTHFPPPPAVR